MLQKKKKEKKKAGWGRSIVMQAALSFPPLFLPVKPVPHSSAGTTTILTVGATRQHQKSSGTVEHDSEGLGVQVKKGN